MERYERKFSEGKIDDQIKSEINQYSVSDDPYEVAVEIGQRFNWNQKQIMQAEKIIRTKYLR